MSEESVYNLVTQLCENILNQKKIRATTDNVKRLRRSAFEILLSKKTYKYTDCFWLENCADYHCQFLAWEYLIRFDYNQPDRARKIEECIQKLQQSHSDSDSLNHIFNFLLKLKKLPSPSINETNINNTEGKFFRTFNNNDFTLNEPFICENAPYNNQSFHLSLNNCNSSWRLQRSLHTTSCSSYFEKLDRGPNLHDLSQSDSLNASQDIWEIVAKSEVTERRSWESYGDTNPCKEVAFFTNANKTCQEKFNASHYYHTFCSKGPISSVQKPQILEPSELISNLKLMLIGFPSKRIFSIKKGKIKLKSNLILQRISRPLLDSYCSLFTESGRCFRALNKMSKRSSAKGIIFEKLCSLINEYLQFYKMSVLGIEDSSGLLRFRQQIKDISKSLFEIASLCKVGPYKGPQAVPHGVALLNRLYQKVFKNSDRNVLLVLYSLLYPSLQVYFLHFLRPWILDGTIEDPHNEFFISPTHKYLSTRGRTYWTRSFTVCEDLIPVFLLDHYQGVFECGKLMNLLKLCKLQQRQECCRKERQNLVQCCVGFQQFSEFSNYVKRYYLQVVSANGPLFSMRNFLCMRNDEKLALCSAAVLKRAAFIKDAEIRKLEKVRKITEKKQKLMRELKAQYDEALLQKKMVKVAELHRELEAEKNLLKFREIEENIIADEAIKMITFYEKLSRKADVFTETIEKRNSCRNIQLDLDSVSPDSGLVLEKDSKEKELSRNNERQVKDSQNNQILEQQSNKLKDQNNKLEEQSNKLEPNINVEKESNKFKEQSDNVEEQPKETKESKFQGSFSGGKSESQRTRLRYLREELGINVESEKSPLSALQKNRNKVLGSSFDLFNHLGPKKESLSESRKNKLKVLQVEYGQDLSTPKKETEILKNDVVDELTSKTIINNEKSPEENLKTAEESQVENVNIDVENNETENLQNNKELTKIESSFVKHHNFEFPQLEDKKRKVSVKQPAIDFSLNEDLNWYKTSKKARDHFDQISIGCVGKSAAMVACMQNELLRQKLLKHFIVDLKYLDHLEHLRSFYFLLDGTVSRNLNDALFEKLYNSTSSANVKTLKCLMYSALKCSLDCENSSISFSINNLPKHSAINDIRILDCISLNYKVSWPLNILLPTDLLGKYDEVFKFLLKINGVSWVLKKIFLDLKALIKEVGRQAPILLLSHQYRKVHAYRHIMTQFMQTFQSYIVGEVLQGTWTEFQDTVKGADTLDELYAAHSVYIKSIHFMCMFNQSSAVVKKVITNIFTVLLKFYNYMRYREWSLDECEFVHPNFAKLADLFDNFLQLVRYLFKAGKVVARTGYQPQFSKLIDMLDVNGFYSNIVGSPKR